MNSTFAFIFDMDGVLIDSNPIHKIALQQFCKKYGHDLTEQQLREKIYGRTNKDWIPNLFGDISPDLLIKYADEKEALFRDLYTTIAPVNGLIQFLDKLDEYKIARAIGTSAPRANVDFTLSKTGMEKYFKIILDDTFVTRGKPDPEIYIKAATALKLPNSQCIVIEDSLAGIKAGKDAGSKVIGITTTHTPEELAEADLIIHDFVDLDPDFLISELF